MCIAAIATAAPLIAQDPIATSPAADEAFLALGDAGNRMTVPVSIGTSGPYGFIIDTGAERTVLSRELARHLRLGAGRDVRVTSMSGSSTVGTVIVPGLEVSRIARSMVEAPALGGNDLGAPGMLGVDSLQGHAVSIDFEKNQMTLRPVARKRLKVSSTPGEVVVLAKSLYGQLIVTDAHYRDHRISVIIDTGSPVTIANLAMLRVMKKPPKPLGQISVTSATGDLMLVDYAQVDRLEIGGILFADVPVGFVDAAPFKYFGLTEEPALLLGMDALRMFRSVQIDFVSRQVRFLFPRGGMVNDPGVRVGL
ncbi:retropepsin-like aspartic protease [soil metagenome]